MLAFRPVEVEMLRHTTLRNILRCVFVLAALSLLLVAPVAHAGGRADWKTTTLKARSDNDAWNVEVTFYLTKAPDVALVPMKFEFLPTAYYERSMMDGDKLVERKVPLSGQREIIETADVGFLDPSSGQTQKRTRFSFKVTRAHGFSAGEYTCTIRDVRNGQTVGSPTHLTFEGQNEVIDRRTITFVGDDGKKKQMKKIDKDGEVKDDKAKPEEKPAAEEKSSDTGSADKSGEDEAPVGEGAPVRHKEGAAGTDPWSQKGEGSPAAEGEGSDPAGEIKEKPGGCGCRTAGARDARSDGEEGSLALAAGLGLVAMRRRRARPRAA